MPATGVARVGRHQSARCWDACLRSKKHKGRALTSSWFVAQHALAAPHMACGCIQSPGTTMGGDSKALLPRLMPGWSTCYCATGYSAVFAAAMDTCQPTRPSGRLAGQQPAVAVAGQEPAGAAHARPCAHAWCERLQRCAQKGIDPGRGTPMAASARPGAGGAPQDSCGALSPSRRTRRPHHSWSVSSACTCWRPSAPWPATASSAAVHAATTL